jgi:GntR family transcriptional regulator, arabinose operon transcriptional repressor
MRERHLGYRRAMEEAGLIVQPEWVRMSPATNVDFADPLAEPEAMTDDYLREAGKIDGVVCSTDFLGVALIKVAREQKRRVPEDLKIVGMDDYDFSATCEVPLSSYRIPYEQIGRGAFEQLTAVLEGNAGPPAENLVRGELVVRAST